MKKRLLHIALSVTVASIATLDVSAQLSPLLTPRIKLKDPGSVNSISIAPPTLAAPYTLTLPPDDGTASQVLTTDGNGVLTWTTQSSGSGTLNTIAKFTSATTIGNSNLDDDGTTIGIAQWGASQRNVIIGNTATNSSIRLRAGTGGIDIGATDIAAGSTISVGGGGNGYTLNLGSGSTLASITQTINLGTGASTGTKLITIGSNATTSSTSLISGSGGINLNASINQPTNINTGTSTGAVSIGNSLSTTAIAGATSITGATTINTTGNANTTIGSATTTGTTTIATNSSTGRFVVSGLPVLTSGTDDVLIINASNQISRIAPINLVGSSWQLTGNATTDAWNGTTGMRLGTTSAQPLVIATTNATAQDIRFFTGGNGASERMRILGTGNVGIGTTAPGSSLHVGGTNATLLVGDPTFNPSNAATNHAAIFSRNIAIQNMLQIDGFLNIEFKAGNAFTSSSMLVGINTVSGVAESFRVRGGLGVDIMTIMNNASGYSGNVGIATTSPAHRLDVSGTFRATGLATMSAGATISGAATSINANSNFTTSINTGTSTGAVTIGNTGNTTTVGSIATTLKTTVGTNDRVVVASSSGQLDQASPAAIIRAGTRAGRVTGLSNAIVTPTAISVPNLDNNDVIIVTLEGAATAVIPVFTIVRTTGVGGTFLVHFSAPYTGTLNWLVIDL